MTTNHSVLGLSLLLAACGGGGGGASPTTTPPAPTASISASPDPIASGKSSTLTWKSTNATACTASGGWSGALQPSGTKTIAPLTATTSYALVCTGTGGTSASSEATVTVMPAPTVMLSAGAAAVPAGASATLTWSSTNATSCTASGAWDGTKAARGTLSTGALTNPATYSLDCTGPGGSSSTASVTVNIIPTVSFTASPASVASGGAATLGWSSTYASACIASGGWSGAEPASGTQSTGSLTAPATYSLACSGPGGMSAMANVTVNIVPTVTLTASPGSVASGGAATLSWTSSNASACIASGGWSGAEPASGTQSTGSLTAPATYSLTCSGPGGSSVASSVTVNIAPTITFTASPSAVASGGMSTLTWSSTNATSCTASGAWSGTHPASGTQSTGSLTAPTTYSLSCAGPGGGSSNSSVTVNIIPTVTFTASPASVASGSASTLTWSSTNATSCTASGGWSGTQPVSGTQSTGALTMPNAYSLACSGPGGNSSTKTILVNVIPLVTLTAYPLVVPSGGSSTLTWSSTNATSCAASGGWSGSPATSGTRSTGALSSTTSYSLTCTGSGGTSNVSTATVTIANGTVSVSPSTAAITLWQTQQFTPTVPGGGAVTWTVDGVAGGNGTVGTITAGGTYTPGTAVGTHSVVATSVANTSESGGAVVAVTSLAGVYTYHDDLARDGANTQEFYLTTANVNTSTFGLLFSCTNPDGAIYAQPLWVANVTVNGVQHNVVLVATEHDSLFAFDADASPCVLLWQANLIDANHGGTAGETTVPSGPTGNLVGVGYGDLTPETGITGTPVIDPSTNTVYVVSASVSASQTTFYQRLHAINLATGNEQSGSPVAIAGTYPGNATGTGSIIFSPQQENQRSGLVLMNGTLYIAWAAHEDCQPYWGWVMSYTYNGSAFTQTGVLNVTPDANGGGIWMDGGAMAADSNNNLYLLTGNGAFDATSTSPPNLDYGDSMLQVSPALNILQYFTPSDELTDEQTDHDFGSGGAAVLADLPAGSPYTHLVMGGGKDGNLYVLNRDLLGGLGDPSAVQMLPQGHGIFSSGAYWNDNYYIASAGGPLNAYVLNTAQAQFSLGSTSTAIFGWPGGTPSISAAGAQAGILWVLNTNQYCTKQSNGCGPAVLFAYDATNMANALWNSSLVSTDAAGNAVKFTVPTVANGKVYVGTRGNNTGGVYGSTSISGELDVYGIKPN
jgi:hypothetical protein